MQNKGILFFNSSLCHTGRMCNCILSLEEFCAATFGTKDSRWNYGGGARDLLNNVVNNLAVGKSPER